MSRLADNGQAAGAVEKGGHVAPPADNEPAGETPSAQQGAGDRTTERPAARPKRTAKPAPPAGAPPADAIASDALPVQAVAEVAPPADNEPPAETPSAQQAAGDRTPERPAARPKRTAKPAPAPDAIASDDSAARAVAADAVSKLTDKRAAKRPPAKRAPAKTTAKAAKPAASTRRAAKPVAPKREVTPRRRATVKPVEAMPVEARALPESPILNGQPAEAAQSEAPARQAVWDARLEACQIGWWRGYVKSQFYAEAIGPEGERYGAGTSPTFRWWRNAPPARTAAAVAAHEALVARLLRAGWERDEQGLEWYEARFCRVSPRSLADRLARVRGQGSPSV